ncbi:DUF3099 domain-containing protein [Hoyosella subflava]|uniref:DUF3099 domain-containing protein n=1 Tax=Hoyosella subflava (strain DSM 45089 / JCM 17490 / NBRC 109087 / DQS3-9A1) TaxID=443218 RepID=F6ELF8_HOYSD|nr:DUF3099 domain-containing protein [Hoyosella subflava]AEF40208.1 hypothetical protein AS9A_1759 [Hoyosella subflava DQS3-9A1]
MTNHPRSSQGGFFTGDESTAKAFGKPSKPLLITGATESFEQQHRARVRKYTILMSFRIPALILAAIAYSVTGTGWVPLLIIALSIPLPWVAVLVANDRPPRRKGEPDRYDARRRAIKEEQRAIEQQKHETIDG